MEGMEGLYLSIASILLDVSLILKLQTYILSYVSQSLIHRQLSINLQSSNPPILYLLQPL